MHRFCNPLSPWIRVNLRIACGMFFVFFIAYVEPVFARSYFDMSETFSSDGSGFPKWIGMMDRFAEQREMPDEPCGMRFHPCKISEWKENIQRWKGHSFSDQLDAANKFGNQFPYIIDQINWRLNDYWETPHEFMDIGGDCEDYAIAKYYTLRGMGIPASRMRIMVVQDFNLGGVIHAILGVYEGSRLYILDNQIKQVMQASKIYHYKPIYGINEEGWWAYRPR